MNTALLVIDVQESFRQRPSWQTISNPDIATSVSRLVGWARGEAYPVCWILHTEPGSGSTFDPASGHVRLLEGLVPAEDEPVLTKTAHNAFTTTNLAQTLTTRGIGKLVVCGIRTEQCCETTTRLASDLGYQVTFVTDATATNPIPHWDGSGRELPAEDVIARTEYALAGRFATISSVGELTGLS